MKTEDVYLNALGTVLPEAVPAPDPAPDAMTAASVAGDTPAVDLALGAAREAVDRWGGSPADIGLVLYADVYHSGPDGWCPQAHLQRHLVGGQALGVEVRQGCNGVFGALELGAAYLTALPPDKAALVVAADNFDSPLIDRWTALDGYCIGDSGAAVVLSRSPGFARLRSVTSTTLTELEQLHRGAEKLHPPGAVVGRRLSFQQRMADSVGEAGLSPDQAALWVKTLQETVFRALDEAGVSVHRIRRAALPNSPRAAHEIGLLPIGLTLDQSVWQYGRGVGHSANDQLLALAHLLRNGELDPGDHFLMVGIGPGVGFAAAVVEIVERPAWAGTGEKDQ
jgi:3-oxoacyl-[acyl-carrier-protein] synthase III